METKRTSARLRIAVSAISIVAVLLAGCESGGRDDTSRWTPERLYSEAKEEAASGNYEKAVKLLERLEGRAAGSMLAQQAQIERAYYLWKSGEKAQALSTLERFIKLHPTSPAIDYAYYLQGLVNFNDNTGLFGSFTRQDLSERDQQASRDSYQSFKQLVDLYPQSLYAEDARARMNYIVNSLAGYEVHVARYYYRRGAYVAAANRAQQVVTEFQQSPSAEEALYIMAASYEKLGLNDLRADAERVLQTSFPNSTIKTEGLRTKKASWWQFW